jgi:hypothetical protein
MRNPRVGRARALLCKDRDRTDRRVDAFVGLHALSTSSLHHESNDDSTSCRNARSSSESGHKRGRRLGGLYTGTLAETELEPWALRPAPIAVAPLRRSGIA